MDRITQRNYDGSIMCKVKKDYLTKTDKNGNVQYFLQYEKDPFERLAEYEDTGLMPDEIKKIKKENADLRAVVARLERKIESDAAWERDMKNGQVQGMW